MSGGASCHIQILLGAWISKWTPFLCFAMIKHIPGSQKIQSFDYFYGFKTVFTRLLLIALVDSNYSTKVRAKTLIKHEKLPKDLLSWRERRVQRSTNHCKWLKTETQTARSFESSPSVARVNGGSSYDSLYRAVALFGHFLATRSRQIVKCSFINWS